jgi:hypothetical protein
MHTQKPMKRLLFKLSLTLVGSGIFVLSNTSSVSASQACADAIGDWGVAGDSWDLSRNAGGSFTGEIGLSSTGAIAAIGGYPKCMGEQYQIVTGSRNGGTVAVSAIQLGVAAYGGQPDPNCPVNVSASVTQRQPGCDHGSAIVSLDGNGISQEWTSQCVVPQSEATSWDSWDDLHGNPMKSVFKAKLQLNSFNFGGRTVSETFPAASRHRRAMTVLVEVRKRAGVTQRELARPFRAYSRIRFRTV